MKKIILLIFAGYVMVTLPSCKKTINRQIEDYVIALLTSSNWMLQLYTEDGLNFTSDFAGYEFKFYENGRLEAIRGTSTESGTWSGNIANESFTSAFPVSGFPLNKLNQTWKITDKYVNVIFAEVQTPAGLVTIRFKKI
jgi:hypothetical protein